MNEETNILSDGLNAAADVAQETVHQFKTMLHLEDLMKFLTWDNLAKIVTSVIAIFIFYIFYRIIKTLIKKGASQKFQPKTVGLLTKAISYIFYILIVMYVLNLLGINLTAIWGAAGVAGVAIGFAAQTSVSNIISGIFVVTDKALKLGDLIEIGGELGKVEKIGLLAIRIKTLDGQSIRIPNSTIIDTNLKNYSSDTKRRWIFEVSFDYETDMEKALEAMQTVPAKCANVLQDPAPGVFYDGFGDSGITMKFAVWMNSSDLVTVKNQMYIAIKKTCAENKINIPFNRMDVTLLDENTIPKKSVA